MSNQRIPVLAKNKAVSTSSTQEPDGWENFTQVKNYVNEIELDPLNMEKGDVYLVLTATPSPWVRAYMLKNALNFEYITRDMKSDKDQMDGMKSLYSAMQDEYKGLLACLALYGNRIKVKKVVLEYSDKDIKFEESTEIEILKNVNNIYEVAGAFGNMLFEEAKDWGDSRLKTGDHNPPFFQLIELDKVVIGATNPFTLAYTAANYKLENNEIPFYKRGRFRDPLDFLDVKQLEKFYHYLKRLKNQIDDFENNGLNRIEKNLISVRIFFREFIQELENFIIKNYPNHKIKKTGVLDYFDKFSFPFDKAFNMDMKIYKSKDGRYLNENETGDLEEFNPDKLLLDSELSKVVMIDSKSGYNPDLSTVLKAKAVSDKDDRKVSDKEYAFALPLSPMGLNEFYSELSDLLDRDKGDKFLTAEYNEDTKTLNVCLELTISESPTPFYKRYHVVNAEEPLNTNVSIWPNFVSDHWNSYFLYSEQVHNKKGIKVLPLYSKSKTTGVLEHKDGSIYHTTLDSRNHWEKEFQADVIVQYDDTQLRERSLNYEIYKSEKPFTGVEIKASNDSLVDTCCGFILMRNNSVDKTRNLINLANNREDLESVSVGIDFGSTNTSVTYSSNKGDQRELKIINRRRFLLGKERNDNNLYALPNELFFFQNDEVKKSIRSAMVFHDIARLVNPEIDMSNAISGGVPVFERNLKILDGDDSNLTIEVAENESAEILFDLKWKREDRFLVNKKAFVKSVWLYVCAELFSDGKKPGELLWSYPSSMPKDLRKTYEGIYQEVIDSVQPIINDDYNVKLAKILEDKREKCRAISESEAVCNYALTSGGIGLNSSSIMVGIDIGGVTSDLLILTTDPGNARARMIKQSSVKMAASKLSYAIGRSKDLQECIAHFARRNKMELPALENINEKSAYYLTNLLFEEIEDNPVLERSLYSELWSPESESINKDETRGLVAIASYICGLLMFHAGQLIRSVIEEDKVKDKPMFKELHSGFNLNVASFGKGGKLFDWLPTALDKVEANKFYQGCFDAGYALEENQKSSVKAFNLASNRKHLKMEVGFGLTSPKGAIVIDENADKEIVGEEGYIFIDKQTGERTSLNWNSPVSAKHIFEFGEDLLIPQPQDSEEGGSNNSSTGLNRFEKFKQVYLDLVKDWNLFDHAKVYHATKDYAQLHLENYVKTDEDWVAGKDILIRTGDQSDFRFSCSPFIYQGMCYLDEVIIKNIYGEE